MLKPWGSGRSAEAGATSSSVKAPAWAPKHTASPTAGQATPAPTSMTSPAHSMPATKGSGGRCWYLPWVISRSGKFSAAACTRTRTSPGAQGREAWGSRRRPEKSSRSSLQIQAR